MAAAVRILLFAVPFLMAVPNSPAIAQARSTAISKLIGILRTERNENVRYIVASILPQIVEDEKPRSTNLITIAEIASLLSDESDAVRGDAALALGVAGPAAAKTVGRLVQALRRAEEEFIRPGEQAPSSFSGDQICAAFEQIGTTPPEAHCKYGTYWGKEP